MGIIKEHLPVKLIIGITYCFDFNIESVVTKLEELQSPVDKRSEIYNFSEFTPYYELEMGKNLKKCFVAFLNLINPDELPLIKINTNELEEKYYIDKKRQVNIDPGYISQAKLILATTKNYSHRIYLGQGIFGDVHMQFSNKSYQSQPWTYPDYKDKNNVIFFNSVRKKYLEQLADI
jgi:hypothetical protein